MAKLRRLFLLSLLIPSITSCTFFARRDPETQVQEDEGDDDYRGNYINETSNNNNVTEELDYDPTKSFNVTWYNGKIILRFDQNVSAGKTPVYRGETPTKVGDEEFNYTFIGWNTNPYAEEPLSSLPMVKDRDLIFYALFKKTAVTRCTVSFFNQGTEIKSARKVNVRSGKYNIKSDLYNSASNPTKIAGADGSYIFMGWALSRPENDRYNRNNVNIITEINITANVSLHACFILSSEACRVTWMNDTVKYDETTHIKGDIPTPAKANPSKSSDERYRYVFLGWSKTSGSSTALGSLPAVYADDVFYAVYRREDVTYKISFYSGETKIREVEKTYGSYTVDNIYGNYAPPTKESTVDVKYEFTGWSNSSTSTELVSGSIEVKKDLSFYAQFKASTRLYYVTWKNFDGKTITTTEHEYGDVPSYKGNAPIRPNEGTYDFVFAGWNTNPNATTALSSFAKISKDRVYYAIYKKQQSSYNQLLEDTTYITSQGAGYTYKDYNMEIKFMPFSELIKDGSLIYTMPDVDGTTVITNITLDSLGKGVLEFPEDDQLVYCRKDKKNVLDDSKLLDGVIIPGKVFNQVANAFCKNNGVIRTLEYKAPSSTNGLVDFTISPESFYNSSKLESIKFGNPHIIQIGESAFRSCSNLKKITFPTGNTFKPKIGKNAFSDCANLTNLGESDTLTLNCPEIEFEAFKGVGFSKIVITTDKLGTDVFKAMPNLNIASLKLTNGTTLPVSTFKDCSKLTELHLDVYYDNTTPNKEEGTDPNVFYIDHSNNTYALDGCDSLKTIYFNGSADQFLSYYKTAGMESNVDPKLRLYREGNNLQVVCSRGFIKSGESSAVTIDNTNIRGYAAQVGISWFASLY